MIYLINLLIKVQKINILECTIITKKYVTVLSENYRFLKYYIFF